MRLNKVSILQVLFILLFMCEASAHVEADLPKWEVGAGIGYLKYEQYPSSVQYRELLLPFPTFQYRGKLLRADERDGARLYLIKRPDWVIQFGGLAFPPLPSGSNEARGGMPDLPALIALGPQIQFSVTPEWTIKAGIYQGFAAYWLGSRTNGYMWEAGVSYQHVHHFQQSNLSFLKLDSTSTVIALSSIGASQEVQALYYGVSSDQSTSQRPIYDATSGFFQGQLSFFQSIKPSFDEGRFAFYFGGRLSDYRLAANRSSPLLKADQNLSILVGLTYSIYKSKAEGTPEDATTGVVDKIEEKIHHRK